MPVDGRSERPIIGVTKTATNGGASIQRGRSAKKRPRAPAKQHAAASTEPSQRCRCCPGDRPGLERGEGGHAIGRDPRKMTRAELEDLGHTAMSPLAALRARCVDCCANSANEVRLCTATKCPSWPYRMATNPWRVPASEAQRETSRRNAAKMRAALADAVNGTGPDAHSPQARYHPPPQPLVQAKLPQ
jgi:hypothetical protein